MVSLWLRIGADGSKMVAWITQSCNNFLILEKERVKNIFSSEVIYSQNLP